MWYKLAKINFKKLIKNNDLVASVIIFRKNNNIIEVLLEKRGSSPHKHDWALPGGHVEPEESPKNAAIREIKEETSLDLDENKLVMLDIHNYRDDKYNCIFTTEISLDQECKAGSDAEELVWMNVENLPDLIWNNKKKIKKAYKKLYDKKM